MLAVQVQYQAVQESIRHDLVTEDIGWNTAGSQRIMANANVMNAKANMKNAKTNAVNAVTNKYNAATNRMNAYTNRRMASAAENQAAASLQNASANMINANVNANLEPSREFANYGSVRGVAGTANANEHELGGSASGILSGINTFLHTNVKDTFKPSKWGKS